MVRRKRTARLGAVTVVPPEPPEPPRRWPTLALLCATQFMVVLDASIVIVALPSIQSSLHFRATDLPWVMNSYLLVFAGFLLLGGRLADRLGRRRVFVGGLALFAGASLACGLAPHPAMLVGARAVQGLGAAISAPAALSILTNTFAEGRERNRALGVWGAVAGGGGAAGVLLGGLLTDLLSWPWIFFLNVPIGAGVAILAPTLLPDPGLPVGVRSDRRHLDLPGAATVTAALVLLVYALVTSTDAGWGSSLTLGCLTGAAALLGTFLLIERRAGDPLVPLGMLRRRTVGGANVVALLFATSLISMFLLLSLYMQQVLGYSPLVTGVGYLASTLAVIVTAARVQPLISRFGLLPVLAGGLGLSVLARLWFAHVGVGGSYPTALLPGLLFAGAGIGLTVVPTTIAAVSGVNSDQAGVTAGLVNTFQQVGGALGVAVLSTVAVTRTRGFLHAHPAEPGRLPHALVSGLDAAFLGAAALAALGLFVAVLVLRGQPRTFAAAAAPPARPTADPRPERAAAPGERVTTPSLG